MLSIAPDEPLASAELWTAVYGLRCIDEALGAARQAMTEVAGLCDATRWQSHAVEVLRTGIVELLAEVRGACSELDFQRDQVARAIW